MNKVQVSNLSALILVGGLLVSGCGAYTAAKSLFVSGVSLQALGDQFEQVTQQVTAGCDSKVIPVTTCDKYDTFGRNFKKVYPLTVGMWQAANKAGDRATQQKAEDVAASLLSDLTKIGIEALGAFAPGVK